MPRCTRKRSSCRTCRRIRVISRSSTMRARSSSFRCCSKNAVSAFSTWRAPSSTRSRKLTSRFSRCWPVRRPWQLKMRASMKRFAPDRFTPAGVLASTNTILYERQLEEYYCTLCYALFDFKRRSMTMANSGLPYPIRCHGESVAQIVLPGVPLGSFSGSTYDEVTFDLAAGDWFVFCSDGVFVAIDALGRELGADRLIDIVKGARQKSARD